MSTPVDAVRLAARGRTFSTRARAADLGQELFAPMGQAVVPVDLEDVLGVSFSFADELLRSFEEVGDDNLRLVLDGGREPVRRIFGRALSKRPSLEPRVDLT